MPVRKTREASGGRATATLQTGSESRPRFFRSAAACRAWLERNHARAPEQWFGFYRAGANRAGVTYAQALDEALCFGWIDGVRKRHDERSFKIRFTPRRPRSKWSRVNLERARALIRSGAMSAAGRAAYEGRNEESSTPYSYETKPLELAAVYLRRFRAAKQAWAYFQAQAPSYRRTSQYWIMSAKREETRERRLAQLIECSARSLWLPQFLIGDRKKK